MRNEVRYGLPVATNQNCLTAVLDLCKEGREAGLGFVHVDDLHDGPSPINLVYLVQNVKADSCRFHEDRPCQEEKVEELTAMRKLIRMGFETYVGNLYKEGRVTLRRASVSSEVGRLARTLWEYHHLNHEIRLSDVVLVQGSHDLRVAERGRRSASRALPRFSFSRVASATSPGDLGRARGAEIRAGCAKDRSSRRVDAERGPVDEHRRERSVHTAAPPRARPRSGEVHPGAEALHGAAYVRDVSKALAGERRR